jgi:hypothetical protein
VLDPYGSFDEDRRRMIAETGAFIAWGLRHPDQVRWIPTRPDGQGGFSYRLSLVFWAPVFADAVRKPASWLRSVLRR